MDTGLFIIGLIVGLGAGFVGGVVAGLPGKRWDIAPVTPGVLPPIGRETSAGNHRFAAPHGVMPVDGAKCFCGGKTWRTPQGPVTSEQLAKLRVCEHGTHQVDDNPPGVLAFHGCATTCPDHPTFNRCFAASVQGRVLSPAQ